MYDYVKETESIFIQKGSSVTVSVSKTSYCTSSSASSTASNSGYYSVSYSDSKTASSQSKFFPASSNTTFFAPYPASNASSPSSSQNLFKNSVSIYYIKYNFFFAHEVM
jgi:hypothetical protein